MKNFDVFILELSTKFSKYIKINDYKKKKLIAGLKSADIKLSPETYIARAYVKAGMVLLSIIPALINNWQMDSKPTWVTSVPSNRRPELVKNFAERLAKK